MKTPDHDPGFYSTPSDDEADKDKKVITPGEFPEEEEGSDVVYEEVPWLGQKPMYYPGISNPAGDYISVSETLYDDSQEEEEEEDEIDIEEAKKQYWKCPNCNELVEMQYPVCWKCQSEMPVEVVHPDSEEVIEEITENSYPKSLTGSGLSLIIIGLAEMLLHKRRVSFFNNNERFVIGGIIIIFGIGLLMVKFYKDKPTAKE